MTNPAKIEQLANDLVPCKRGRILTHAIDDLVAHALAVALGKLPITETIYIVTTKAMYSVWSKLLAEHANMPIGSGRYNLVTADALRIEFDRVGYIHTVVFDRLNGGPKTGLAAALIADKALRVWIWGPNPAVKFMRQVYEPLGFKYVPSPLPE